MYDRTGKALAKQGTAVAVGIEPRRVKNEEETFLELQRVLGKDFSKIREKYKAPGVKPYWFVPVTTLSEEDYKQFRPRLAPIPGVVFKRKRIRTYPYGDLAAHILGYVGEVTSDELKKLSSKGLMAGDLVGKAGLEKSQNEILVGIPGNELAIVTPEGKKVKVLAKREAKSGKNIYLTLDVSLQKVCEETLDDRSGAVVAMDPGTGEILALASGPTFNPNAFILGMPVDEWAELRDDPRQPMINRALSRYPPGSSFKIVTSAAALDTGKVTPETEFEDEGVWKISGNTVTNYQNKRFEKHSFSQALANSINTTFAKLGVKLGAKTLVAYAKRFGFQRDVPFPLPVAQSKVGDASEMDQVDMAWTAVGQAKVITTPLQMALVAATIANKGTMMMPILINKQGSRAISPEEWVEVVSYQTSKTLTALLNKVVKEGTGVAAQIAGVEVAGKTGTAEISKGSEETHAWFVGFAPVNEPEIAVAILVEKGGVGGEVAAPIAKRVIQAGMQRSD